MTEDKANHWNSLAEQVGAEVPDEPAETAADSAGDDQPALLVDEPPQSQAPPVVHERKPEARPVAPPRKNHWGLVAGELGLEAPVEEETEAVETSSADDVGQTQIDVREPAPFTIEPARETVRAETTRQADNHEIPSSAFSSRPQESEAASMFAETEDAEFLDEPLESTEIANEQSASVADESTKEKEDADDGGERPRRRRRRPRRRSRRDQESSTQDDSSDTSAADDDEPVQKSDDKEASDTEDDEEESSSDRDHGDATKSKHRNIPTWEDAIGVVVTANIEAKAKSSSSGGGGGPRRGRGRGRGGSKR